jgi:hypothetical protein
VLDLDSGIGGLELLDQRVDRLHALANVYCQYSISTCAQATPAHDSAAANVAASHRPDLTVFVVILFLSSVGSRARLPRRIG